MHNTFDIKEEGGLFKSYSHNFPEFVGEGADENKAIEAMSAKIAHYALNKPKAYNARIKDRIKRGLYCECGVRLEEPVLAIYTNTGGDNGTFCKIENLGKRRRINSK